MLLKGEFIDNNGTTVSVEIVTGGKRTPSVTVNDGISGVYFTASEAVTIEGETNDVFDPCLRQSARVSILTPRFLPDLFLPDVMESDAVIRRGGETVFRGRVLPQTYSQPFVESLDTLDINLIDHLSAMEYLPWRVVMGDSRDPLTFRAMFHGILERMCPVMTVEIPQSEIYRMPGSPAVSLLDASVNPGIFMDEDDEESDTTLLEAMEGALRYLGLHLTQEGDSFRFFRRENQALLTHGAVSISNAEGTDTQIEVGEMFNKISVEVDCEEKEELIEAPLDSDMLTSPYAHAVSYCKEYCMLLDNGSWSAYRNLIAGLPYPQTHGDSIWTREWYVRYMEHKGWRFYCGQKNEWDGSLEGHGPEYADFATAGESSDKGRQLAICDLLNMQQGSGLFRLGTARTDYKADEWNPPATLTEEDCLVIGIDGDHQALKYETGETSSARLFREKQRFSIPRAIYRGAQEGVALSPDDEETTRYIVITGEMALAPVIEMNHSFAEAKAAADNVELMAANPGNLINYVQATGAGDAQRYRAYTALYESGWRKGLTMFDEQESAQIAKIQTRYNAHPNNPIPYPMFYRDADLVAKVGVLVCMLIVGDKCLVEKDESGDISALVWEDYRTPAQCGSLAEYIKQSFTIGIDPKNGDPLIGKWYDIANNVHYTMGIGEEGMAIPVRASDNVTGQVTFIILGPADIVRLKENTSQKLMGGRYGYLNEEGYCWKGEHIMRCVSAVWLKDFEIKIVSDNGGSDPIGDGRLVYMSDTSDGFRHARDPETFLFGSALTKEERDQLGLRDMVRDNTVIAPGGGGVTEVTDPLTGETAKPEQLYVDRYYHECARPAIELTQSLRENKLGATIFRGYTHPALEGKVFLPLAISRDLSEGTARLTMREKR